MKIEFFSGEYRWLSNFYPATVELDGRKYPSVEHAYQAAKTLDFNARIIFEEPTMSPGMAKRLGRNFNLRPGWDQMKVSVMLALLKQKFAPGTPLAAKLLATGEAELIEGNTWGDRFWGVCQGTGRNTLGALLMGVRKSLEQSHA